jgi:hypothetical protein
VKNTRKTLYSEMSGNMPGRNVLQLLNDLRTAQLELDNASQAYAKAMDVSMSKIQEISEELADKFGFNLVPAPDTGGDYSGNGSVLLT